MACVLGDITDWSSSGREGFEVHTKPRVAEMLRAVGLDVVYERAVGDRIEYRDPTTGDLVAIVDALGGYGAGLFGHNHPRIIARAESILVARRPFLAQGSVRSLAGALAARLSGIVGKSTGKSYVVQFGSTGADATEAAIKHAVLELGSRKDALARANRAALLRFEQLARSGGGGSLASGVFSRASSMLGAAVGDHAELAVAVARVNAERTPPSPVFFAVTGAFHGKSTGALSLTYNPSFREPWAQVGLAVEFLPAFDVDAIAPAFARATVPYARITLSDAGVLDVAEARFVNVAACFYEPIQGEGGVVAVPDAYAKALREATARAGVPLVIDEIQSGMGRTGTFLASEPSGVVGDYYLLSKSLGGSLAKISAMLVDRERYDREFGYLHTSTFVEDDFSSAIALEALQVLDDDDLPARARAKGDALLAKLGAVQKKYPSQIRALRGRGLMIGVEFDSQKRSPSPFLRVAAEQGLLGYLLAGYLLRVHRVRMAPTLSSPETLRIQPSAYVSDADLDVMAGAIEAVAGLLAEGRAAPFALALLGKSSAGRAPAPKHEGAAASGVAPVPPIDAQKVAFLGHFLEDQDVIAWDPSLGELSPDECRALLDKTKGLLDPFLLASHTVRSGDGTRAVGVTVIGIPFTSSQIMDGFRVGDTAWAREQVDRAVALAEEHGATIIGFGGYTSIVTNNCRTIIPERAALTSGNALTAAACVRAVLRASERLALGPLRVGIVGALGNIGHVLAELLIDDAASMVLVGRASGTSRLAARAEDLAVAAWRRALGDGVRTGLPGALLLTPFGRVLGGLVSGGLGAEPLGVVDAIVAGAVLEAVAAGRPASQIAEGVRATLAAASRGTIAVSTSLDDLAACNVVLAASNAPRPLLEPRHFGHDRVLVVDVAVPGDVDPRVAHERPNVVVIAGGRVRLPGGQQIELPGMPSEEGSIYGCLAETLLLGLEGHARDFATGALSPEIVRRAGALAERHGFVLDEGDLGDLQEMDRASSERVRR